jgi:hypothetical protein
MKRAFLLSLIWLILGCSSTPIPDWTYQSFNALESYKTSALTGKSALADQYFERAVAETKRSGDLKLLGRVYLTRMAMETVLQWPLSEKEYLAIEDIAPDQENGSFFRLLRGDQGKIDGLSFPTQYRDFYVALQDRNEKKVLEAIGRMDDPCSQVIAISVCGKWGTCRGQGYQTAIDTASRQGWKKVLLIYLQKLANDQDSRGEKEKAALTRKKLDLLND